MSSFSGFVICLGKWIKKCKLFYEFYIIKRNKNIKPCILYIIFDKKENKLYYTPRKKFSFFWILDVFKSHSGGLYYIKRELMLNDIDGPENSFVSCHNSCVTVSIRVRVKDSHDSLTWLNVKWSNKVQTKRRRLVRMDIVLTRSKTWLMHVWGQTGEFV